MDVTGPKEEVTVRPIEEQAKWESRTLWCKVAKGIQESDFEAASREKSRIEVSAIFPEPYLDSLWLTTVILTRIFLQWALSSQTERTAPKTARRDSGQHQLATETLCVPGQ